MRTAQKRYPVDRTKLHHALWRRGKNASTVCRENYYGAGWLNSMVCRGYITERAMEVLQGYGITEEEIRP